MALLMEVLKNRQIIWLPTCCVCSHCGLMFMHSFLLNICPFHIQTISKSVFSVFTACNPIESLTIESESIALLYNVSTASLLVMVTKPTKIHERHMV